MKLETTLLKTITKKQVYKNSFSDIVATFEKKLLDFNPVDKAFEIEKYFLNSGQVTVTKKLIADNIISKDWLREYTTKRERKKLTLEGYIFSYTTKPQYM